MIEPEHDVLLADITTPELRASLKHLGEMMEKEPWPEQPAPPLKPEPLYKVEPWKDSRFYAVMKQVTGGKKDLVVVTACKKGAQEVARLLEAQRR